MKPKIVLRAQQFDLTIKRLCHQLIENHDNFSGSAIIGLQPRGIYLARRIHKNLVDITKNKKLLYGELDATFYRDDFRKKDLVPKSTSIDFIIEDKKVILVDDVLYTGRTIRAGMDALLDFGRPKAVELLVLIDRKYSRHLPIQPDYVGMAVDTISSDKVKVDWKETEKADQVLLMKND